MNNYINKNFLSGSAIIVSIVIMAGIFIMAFSSAYIVITSTSRESKIAEAIKAEQVLNSGVERLKYEIYSNGFDIDTFDCSNDLFTLNGENYSYIISCVDIGEERKIYVSGTYKNKTITKEITLPFVCGFDTVLYEGYEYGTVRVGRQCWLSENLKYLPYVSPSADFSDLDPFYYVYGYQGTSTEEAILTSNYNNYGVLYNWPAAMNSEASESSRGACPEGWHVPSDSEIYELELYLTDNGQSCDGSRINAYDCSSAARKLKSARTLVGDPSVGIPTSEHPRWNYDSDNYGTDIYGFSIFPAGFRTSSGSFGDLGNYTYFWSSSSLGENYLRRQVNYLSSQVYRAASPPSLGFSVRCLKD